MKPGRFSTAVHYLVAFVMVFESFAAGCGKSPLRPPAQTSKTSRSVSAGKMIEQDIIELPSDEYKDPNGNSRGFQYAPQDWHGGHSSLPTGPYTTPASLLTCVDSIKAVQAAKAEFSRRGYTRDAGLDSVIILDKQSTVLIGYLKPGYARNQAIAYIVVVTRRVDFMVPVQIGDASGHMYYGGWIPVTEWRTQVGGGLAIHSASDSLLFVNNSSDPPISISQFPVSGFNNVVTITAGDSIAVVSRADLEAAGAAADGKGEWISASDIYGYAPADNTYTWQPSPDPYYWQKIEQYNREWAKLIGVVGIAATFGFLAVVLPESGPLDAEIIRRAFISAGVTGAAAGAGYWVEHTP